jgi:hypothetical protein
MKGIVARIAFKFQSASNSEDFIHVNPEIVAGIEIFINSNSHQMA